jgi:hypothetical protein
MSPSRDEHLAKESHNAALEVELRTGTKFPDWAATVAFYRALHLIDAFLAQRGTHPVSHYERNNAVRRLLPGIADAYLDLYRLSLHARYEALDLFGPEEYDNARGLFDEVESTLRPQTA